MVKITRSRKTNTFLWLTEEWLIVLIAVLVLLAIAIGAAGAKTLIFPKSDISQTYSASMTGNDKE